MRLPSNSTLAILTVPVAVGLIAFAWAKGQRPLADRTSVDGLSWPRQLDVGPVRQGDVVVKRISLRNHGNCRVRLLSLETDCGCSAATVDRSQMEKASAPEIAPGKSLDLEVTWTVHGRVGMHAQTIVRCTTDHPGARELLVVLFAASVSGRPAAYPAQSIVPPATVGRPIQETVEVRDNRDKTHGVAGIACELPDGVIGEWVAAGPDADVDNQRGTLLGTIHIRGFRPTIGNWAGKIDVLEADHRGVLLTVPVIGTTVESVRAFPDELVLPRQGGDRLVWDGRIMIVCEEEALIDMRVDDLPAGVRVDFPSGNRGRNVLAVVRVDPSVASGSAEPLKITFTAKLESGSAVSVHATLHVRASDGHAR